MKVKMLRHCFMPGWEGRPGEVHDLSDDHIAALRRTGENVFEPAAEVPAPEAAPAPTKSPRAAG
jgi:hypothetical protein